MPPRPRVLARAPQELMHGRLRRLGEGIGKVVYASEHWVVKRERTPSEIIALILVWKLLRRISHLLPAPLGSRLLRAPSRSIRLMRVMMQTVMLILPRSVWFSSHLFQIWKIYRSRARRGERLANLHLAGTGLLPERVTFPPTRVATGGWPGWLKISEANERVEDTLHTRLTELARAGRFDEVEVWLDRFLALRPEGWRRGIFSVDAHLKNFGVCGRRIVLLDSGGLTDRWPEVASRLSFDEGVPAPHIQLGLGPVLAARPDIAQRFDARWKAMVNRETVGRMWPRRTA